MRLLNKHFSLCRIFSGVEGLFSGDNFPGRRGGFTLVELMVALAILTIGVVGMMGSFEYIQKSVQLAKNKTLASNLAQEKMQILKQKSYYQVIVTSSPAYNIIDFAPEVVEYDMGYFPPEQIMEAGVTYTRYTYVQGIKEDSGALATLAPNIADTGMKRITITVMWESGRGKRKVTVRSILSNPDTIISNVVFNGVIRTTSSVVIGGALVQVVEASGCSDTTSSSGLYNIITTPGTYTLMVSATGYYTATKSVVIAAGNTQTNNFDMAKIGTGRIIGYPWLNDHLVISQVVGSTIDVSVTPNFDQEYVEVFNPSTFTWTMGGNIGLKFQRASDLSEKTIQITYYNDEIPSHGYYLFANTGTVVAGGEVVDADAVWAPGNPTSSFPYFATQDNIIPVDGDDGVIPSNEGGGAVKLYSISDGTVLDKVGWNKSYHPAPFYEGAAIIQTTGLSHNEAYTRFTSTSDFSGVNSNYGPAYDSNNNSLDFYDYMTLLDSPPHGSFSGVKPVISGTPAAGAVISCADGLSASTEAVIYANPSPNAQSYAYFSLVDVATGAWTTLISSGIYSLERSTVSVPSPGSVYIFDSTSTFLTQSNSQGIIAGRVLNVGGAALNGITVTSGGATSTNTGTDGRYRLRVDPGTMNITANPSGGSATYVQASSNSISVDAGEIHGGVDFTLYQGGRVSGKVTMDGTNGLPGVAVAIFDANSVAKDQQVSGADGRFTSVILSTGYYIVQPAIGALEASNPIASTVTILGMGSTMFSSTFTITGALGAISGTVTSGGQPIKTGVLIVVTTTTLTGSPPAPPALSSATLTGPPFYMVSSMENGTYQVEVRNGSLYRVYAYYPSVGSASAVIYSSNTAANVSVTAGQTISGVNFSW